MTLEELDISVQAYHCFKKVGIDTVDQLKKVLFLEDSINSIPKKYINEANKKLGILQLKPPEIEINSDDFGLVLNCAVRYALGRRTYVTSSIPSFIAPLLPYINDRTLYVLDQDITDQKYYGGYGEECDRVSWMQFHEKVKAEEKYRGMKPYKSFKEVDATQ